MRKLLWLLLTPYFLVAIGAALNCIALTANSGMMPVMIPANADWTPGQLLDSVHIAWHSRVHLAILCDWIMWFNESVCSPGDLVLWLGEWITPYALGAFVALSWKE